MNIELSQSELAIYRKSVQDQLQSGVDFFCNANADEFVPVAEEISVLAKVRDALDKEMGTDEDGSATNDTALSDWN